MHASHFFEWTSDSSQSTPSANCMQEWHLAANLSEAAWFIKLGYQEQLSHVFMIQDGCDAWPCQLEYIYTSWLLIEMQNIHINIIYLLWRESWYAQWWCNWVGQWAV